jgi:hypothetical protein
VTPDTPGLELTEPERRKEIDARLIDDLREVFLRSREVREAVAGVLPFVAPDNLARLGELLPSVEPARVNALSILTYADRVISEPLFFRTHAACGYF